MSTTSHIISLLVEERTRLQAAIDALKGEPEHGLPDWVLLTSREALGGKKKGMSAAARRRIGEATRARWAARRGADAETTVPAASAPKKRTMSEEGRQRIIAATKARWARVSAAKAKANAPKKKSAKAAIAEATAPKEEAEFKARMSAAMKKVWAKRKKAARKKASE